MIIGRIKYQIEKIINSFFSTLIHKKKARQLKNRNFTIISSNCNGGVILHDLGQPFDTPTINLWMSPEDYLKFCRELRAYTLKTLIFIHDEKWGGIRLLCWAI